jgi:pimeloyl-ACP methyl ester carboxylesterase
VNNLVNARVAFRVLAAFLFAFSLAAGAGCYPSAFRSIRIPLTTIQYDAANGPHRQLFVYLPGNGDAPTAFDRNGMIKEMRKRGLTADILAVDAYLAYYSKGIIFDRLKQDVIDPAKATGYTDIWLIGNSLGAYGSLSYARLYPQDIAGVVLLGPYLGEKKTIKSIIEAGGLQAWDPRFVGNSSLEDWDKRLWLWLKDIQERQKFTVKGGAGGRVPIIYLGYGEYDRFSYSQKLLAEVLPAKRVASIAGGHDWWTWKELWRILLDRMISENPGGQVVMP